MMPLLVPIGLAALALLSPRRHPPAAMVPAGGRRPAPGAQAAVAKILPFAELGTRTAGTPQLLPLALAQAMLESGWGRATPGNNYYGIKGTGPAGSVTVPTREEFQPGQITRIRAAFRAYNNAAESVADWLRFVTGGRYTPARQMSPIAAALWVWAAGYATASRYVPALVATSRRIAAAAGRPDLALQMTSGQADLAAALGALPPGQRRAAALQLYKAGKWPA